MEGLVLKYSLDHPVLHILEAPRGGAGIEMMVTSPPLRMALEAPRGGAGIEIDMIASQKAVWAKPLVEGLVLK